MFPPKGVPPAPPPGDGPFSFPPPRFDSRGRDDIALSTGALDWVGREQHGRAELLQNIQQKNLFHFMGGMRAALAAESMLTEEAKDLLDALEKDFTWDRAITRLRPLLMELSDEGQKTCRKLWELLSHLSDIESKLLKEFTDEAPPDAAFQTAVAAICDPFDLDAAEMLNYIGLPELFSFEEFRQKLDESRELIPPEAMAALKEYVRNSTVLCAPEELRDFARGFERLKTAGLPSYAFTRFHEIRRCQGVKFAASFAPTAKALRFATLSPGEGVLPALVEHEMRHVADNTLGDMKAPLSQKRYFPSFDGPVLQPEGSKFVFGGAVSPFMKRTPLAPGAAAPKGSVQQTPFSAPVTNLELPPQMRMSSLAAKPPQKQKPSPPQVFPPTYPVHRPPPQ